MSRISSILNYPYKIKPHCDFVTEISQLKSEALTISPFGYFVTKSPLTSNLTKTKKWLVNKNFLLYKISPSLSLEHLQVISKLVENSNLHTINKKYTFQEQVCERCLNKRNCNCQRKKIQSINVIMQCNATPPKCINSQHGLLSHSQLPLNAMPKKISPPTLLPLFVMR